MGRVKNTPHKNKYQEDWIAAGGIFNKKSTKKKKSETIVGTKIQAPNNDSIYCSKIWIGETNNSIPEKYEACRTHIDDDTVFIYFDTTVMIVQITTDIQFLIDLISSRIFSIKFECTEGQVTALLYFKTLPLNKFNKKIGSILKIVFNLSYQIGAEILEQEKKSIILSDTHEISEFYSRVKTMRMNEIKVPDITIEHPALIPILRAYQKDAVKWMIYRETPCTEKHELHPMFEEIKLESGFVVYFNKYLGYLETEKPLVSTLRTGGILADEMGLGKTVEVLACILVNPKKEDIEEILPSKRKAKYSNKIYDTDEDDDFIEDDIPLIEYINRNKSSKSIKNNETIEVSDEVEDVVENELTKNTNNLCKNNEIIEISGEVEDVVEKESASNTNYLIKYNETIEVIDTHEEKTEPSNNVNHLGQNNETVDIQELPKSIDLDRPSTSGDRTINKPVVEKQGRRRHITSDKLEPLYVDKPKKLKINKDWIKGKSKMPDYKIALQMWYENVLGSVNVNRSLRRSEYAVRCICGEDDESGTVKCIECKKVQHKSCMGYVKKYGQYRCPQCWMEKKPLLEVKGTLIVCPLSLLGQWTTEICKHVAEKLDILIYDGGKSAPIYPQKLCQYDIVITTYNVLQTELRISETSQPVSLRRAPKYSYPGSPIAVVKWWRLCLDEAQTVEAPGHMVSAMAHKLEAYHRWAVTGTPISRSISDIYGLINYLKLDPYSDEETWTHLLYNNYLKGNYDPLCKFLSKVLWRSTKEEVVSQINIPKQTVIEHWLEFSAVERFFYDKEHDLSSKEFLEKIKKFNLDTPLKALDKKSMKSLLVPLLSLRQACAHHNAVKGRYLATRKQFKSMDDLLDALIAKNINDCEECARIIISGLNGLAGISLLMSNPGDAIKYYRQVLQFAADFEKHSEKIKNNITFVIDKLQLIHTMYNLKEILEIHPNIEPPTLRDEKLIEDCKILEEQYMQRYNNESVSALTNATKITGAVSKLQQKFQLKLGQWYSDMIDWIITNSLSDELLLKIMSLFDTNGITDKNKFIQNERKVFYLVAGWDEDITELREKTLEAINNLYTYDESSNKINTAANLVQVAVDCHLRNEQKNKPVTKCSVCVTNEKLKEYELKLFSMVNKNTEEDEILAKGSWKPSKEELVLKAVHSLCKSKNVDEAWIQDGNTHLALLEVMKKEFKEVRKLWTLIDQQVCAQDEIDMCKIRLKLKEKTPEGENKPKRINVLRQLEDITENRFATIHLLGEHELDFQRICLQNEVKVNGDMLEKFLGTHSYLQTLRTKQTEGAKPDPCPICQSILESQWNMLICGHCYCLTCVQVLIGQTVTDHIICSVCRQKQPLNDISFIDLTQKEQGKGNYSSKVEAVVNLILKLKEEDKDVKVLVFSHWNLLLNIMKTVLQSKSVLSDILNPQSIQKTLDKFKDYSKGVTALLIPITLGSKGLNLIEATHVIFLEPLLNPGDEHQAVGRIHRIGQTKPTFVHKFLVKNTIEENIHHSTTSNALKWDSNKVTLREFKALFEESIETIPADTATVVEDE